MATRQIAQYATPGGATVTVTEKAWFGLVGFTWTASCTGCGAGVTHGADGMPTGMAESSTTYWAERHSAGCRRIPSSR